MRYSGFILNFTAKLSTFITIDIIYALIQTRVFERRISWRNTGSISCTNFGGVINYIIRKLYI